MKSKIQNAFRYSTMNGVTLIVTDVEYGISEKRSENFFTDIHFNLPQNFENEILEG